MAFRISPKAPTIFCALVPVAVEVLLTGLLTEPLFRF